MNADTIAMHIGNAAYYLKEARKLAPNKSNLSDDLDKAIEDAESLSRAVKEGEFDDAGFSK